MKKTAGNWTRREALGLGGLAAGTLALPGLGACSSSKPKNIIFLVSDGMSAGVPAMAEPFSHQVRGKGTHWHRLSRRHDVAHGLFDMASLDSLVTDSAAAASAWGSGRRVPNRVLNQFPDGTALKPLCPVLKEHGLATGLVTTARMTHATPAGFCASTAHRDYEDEIAPQYLDQVDVLMGGGDLHFSAEYRLDGRDLAGDFVKAGYTHCTRRQDLLNLAGKKKVLGLFYPDHLPYTIDRDQSPPLQGEVPTLAEMTAKALELLSQHRQGFFLMVEAARVDHAAHANDAAGILWDQLAFDDAIGEVLAFQQKKTDTLVVISSDHGNANPGLNGIGPSYTESSGFFRRLARVKSSATEIKRALEELFRKNRQPAMAELAGYVQSRTGFLMNRPEAEILSASLNGKETGEISGQQQNFYAQLGQILGNWHGVGWTGVTHTSDWTLSLATGPGRERFSGLLKNVDFFDRVLELCAITYRNPEYQGKIEEILPEERGMADPTG